MPLFGWVFPLFSTLQQDEAVPLTAWLTDRREEGAWGDDPAVASTLCWSCKHFVSAFATFCCLFCWLKIQIPHRQQQQRELYSQFSSVSVSVRSSVNLFQLFFHIFLPTAKLNSRWLRCQPPVRLSSPPVPLLSHSAATPQPQHEHGYRWVQFGLSAPPFATPSAPTLLPLPPLRCFCNCTGREAATFCGSFLVTCSRRDNRLTHRQRQRRGQRLAHSLSFRVIHYFLGSGGKCFLFSHFHCISMENCLR